MNDLPMPDGLDEFLANPPNVPHDAGRKDALFYQTAALLPRPRWKRWPVAVAAAAGAACLMFAAWYFLRGNGVDPAPKNDLVEHKQAPEPIPPKPNPAEPIASPPNPVDLEWIAFDAPDDQRRSRLYFQAGDLYLAVHNDIDSAVRCYQQALHYADSCTLQFDANDNWLVMSLKRDRRKEP